MSSATEIDQEQIAHQRQIDILRSLSPERRLQEGLRMNRAVRELLAVGFRSRHPQWTEQRILEAVAERILHARTD